jgi:tetratricopeptide (TPR) repeat protein
MDDAGGTDAATLRALVRVGPSATGLGLFAARDIAAGTVVAEYTGSLRFGLPGDTEYAKVLGPGVFVDARALPELGLGRWVNDARRAGERSAHALPPPGGSDDAGRSRALGANLCDLYTADAPPRVFMVATRAIKEDEELLTDYGASYWRGREALMGARARRGSPKARSDAGGAAPPRRAAVAGARRVTPADLPGLGLPDPGLPDPGLPDPGLPRFDVDALAESFLRAAALTPKPARALSNAAVALARAERADEALHWAARAATLRPDDAGVKQNNDEVVAWANVGHAAPWERAAARGTASEPGAPSLPRRAGGGRAARPANPSRVEL